MNNNKIMNIQEVGSVLKSIKSLISRQVLFKHHFTKSDEFYNSLYFLVY